MLIGRGKSRGSERSEEQGRCNTAADVHGRQPSPNDKSNDKSE
jgi:hypothetical protein